MHAAWLGIPLLLAADASLAQFRPLWFDDDFAAQRQACADDDNRSACWKDLPLADHVRLSVGGDLRVRYEHTGYPRYGLDRQDRWGVLMRRGSIASLDFFWRHSTRDGVYAPNGLLMRGPGASRARYVATIASLGATWTLPRGWSATAVVAWAQPGAFLRETGADDPLSFISAGAQYRF